MVNNDGTTEKKWKVIMTKVKFELNIQELTEETAECWHCWHSGNSRYAARETQ